MTIDEIAQKIYEERYAAPKHPDIAEMLRDGMVREIVSRALELSREQQTVSAETQELLRLRALSRQLSRVRLELTLEEVDLVGAAVHRDRDRVLDAATGNSGTRLLTDQELKLVPTHQEILRKIEEALTQKVPNDT